VEQQPVALAVPLTALQRMDDFEVVFVREGERYSARPVKLGRRDAKRVEVLSGLKAGEQVVVEQSFLIKADIEKAGAS
ncbi:efflux transporter periplasmic adaptor subunit, partial [Lysobacter sp. 2RAB21]